MVNQGVSKKLDFKGKSTAHWVGDCPSKMKSSKAMANSAEESGAAGEQNCANEKGRRLWVEGRPGSQVKL